MHSQPFRTSPSRARTFVILVTSQNAPPPTGLCEYNPEQPMQGSLKCPNKSHRGHSGQNIDAACIKTTARRHPSTVYQYRKQICKPFRDTPVYHPLK